MTDSCRSKRQASKNKDKIISLYQLTGLEVERILRVNIVFKNDPEIFH